jgi:Cdc6-like AAA superfamily ATPase
MSNPDAESSTPGVKKHHPSFAKLKSQLGIEPGQPGGILYGREKEITTLEGAYQRFLRERRQELVLVSGHPGSGKENKKNTNVVSSPSSQ